MSVPCRCCTQRGSLAGLRHDEGVDRTEISAACEDVFDQAIQYHGFADYMRDYDLYIYATADPRTGVAPDHLRYRFTHCVRATATSAVPPAIWKRSLDERLIDFETGRELDGYVWGVRWQALYPGISLVEESAEAARWSEELGIPFFEAIIETNGHNLSLVFSDLRVDVIQPGTAPFVVPGGGARLQDPALTVARVTPLSCALATPPGVARVAEYRLG